MASIKDKIDSILKKIKDKKDNRLEMKKNKAKAKQEKKPNSEIKLNKKGKPKTPKKQIALIIFDVILFICVICGIGGIIFACWFANYIVKHAPALDKDKLLYSESSLIYDSQGNLLEELGNEKRDLVEYDNLPQVLIDAIIATEDSEYFQHNGINVARFAKASFWQVLGKNGGGASTISMQVIKNNFTSSNSKGWEGIVRKFTDIYLAVFKLEKEYTKEQIMEFYVNKPFLGSNSYGMQQAAKTYFGKDVSDLSLPEAALLAGLFKAPGSYDPYSKPESATKRRDTVLYLMVRHGYITQEEADAAKAVTVQSMLVGKDTSVNKYSAFIDTAIDEVIKKTGLDPRDVPMTIYTTMIPSKQNHINYIVDGGGYNFPDEYAQTGIAVVDVNTGAIVAIGAGRHRKEGDYNFATQSKRQIGSNAKPLFDYGPAVEFNKWSTYQPILDESYSYSNGKSIKNDDGGYKGLLTLKQALGLSRNIPALKTFQSVENSNIYKFVTSLGITPETSGNSTSVHEAHAIGAFTGSNPLQLAAAYAAFANGGYYIEPYSVTKIVYRDTNETVEYSPKKTKVMEDYTAFMVTNMLKWSTEYGMSHQASYISGIDIAAKTGTTNFDEATIKRLNLKNSLNDLWVTGYSPDYAVSMWYGYNEVTSEHYNTTKNWSTRNTLYKAIIKGIFENNGHRFQTPNSVSLVSVESGTVPAMLPSEYTPGDMIVQEYFIKGTEPTEVSPRFKKLNSVTNLNAKIENREIKLTWDYNLPEQLTESYLRSYYNNEVFKGFEEKYYNKRIEEDSWKIGKVVFNVYLKDSSGNLTFLKQTSDKNYTYKVSKNTADLEFVVKTTYTILTNNVSDPTSIKISTSEIDIPVLTLSLSTNKETNVYVGSNYTLPSKAPVIVLDSLTDVTKDSNIKTSIKKDGTDYNSTTLDTTTPCKYTITYTVTYKGVSDSITQTIKVITKPSNSGQSSSSPSSSSSNSSSSNISSSSTSSNSSNPNISSSN